MLWWVLLKMKAVSLNYRDYLMVGRGYGKMSGELPLVPLSDGVGEVVALGDGVEDVAMGSRRLPCFIQNWYDGDIGPSGFSGALGGPLDGTAREYMAVPVTSSVEVPDHFADIEAATLGCAAITAWNALAEMPKTAVGGAKARSVKNTSRACRGFCRVAGAHVNERKSGKD